MIFIILFLYNKVEGVNWILNIFKNNVNGILGN